jgi:hypothetical protein
MSRRAATVLSDAGGARAAATQAWEFDFETELDLEMDQMGADLTVEDVNEGGGEAQGTGSKGGSGMQRAVAISRRRVQRRAAVLSLWQQYAASQALPDS